MSEVVCWQIIPGSSSIALLLVRGDGLDTMTTITIILSDNTVIISDVEARFRQHDLQTSLRRF